MKIAIAGNASESVLRFSWLRVNDGAVEAEEVAGVSVHSDMLTVATAGDDDVDTLEYSSSNHHGVVRRIAALLLAHQGLLLRVEYAGNRTAIYPPNAHPTIEIASADEDHSI